MQTVRFFATPGIELAGDLYLPSPAPAEYGHPGVVACLGWGSVKELMEPWASALVARGYAVLVTDYRGFGASGGERGRCFPNEHVDDIRASITYLEEHPGIDSARLALVGVSYGGAVAVAGAGVDGRPGALVSVVGYGDGRRHLQHVRTPKQWDDFRTRLDEDRRRRVLEGRSEEVDPDEILQRDEEARAWRRQTEERFPHMAFRTTLESAEKIVDFRPERYLPFDSPTPALFIHAGGDQMIPVEESRRMWERAEEPKELVIIPDIGHHEVHGGVAFQQVIGHIDDWLTRHLAGLGGADA